MILTWTCDLCGWNNDNNGGACHKCGGETKEMLVGRRMRTVIVKKPTIPMRGYYNSAVIEQPSK
jgi:hypothetical protein